MVVPKVILVYAGFILAFLVFELAFNIIKAGL
jgi:hypothetical protein